MNAATDWSNLIWSLAVTAPLLLACFGVGIFLLIRRRSASRACLLAGAALIVLGIYEVFIRLLWEVLSHREIGLNNDVLFGFEISFDDIVLFSRLSSLIGNLLLAAAIVLLAAAILMAARSANRPEPQEAEE